MSCESEAIRDHNRCVRGTADPAMSVMRILRDSDLYNPLQLDKVRNETLLDITEGTRCSFSGCSIFACGISGAGFSHGSDRRRVKVHEIEGMN